MKKQLFLAGLMGSTVLLAACGGSGNGGSGQPAAGSNSTNSTSNTNGTNSTGGQSAPSPESDAFACPPYYKKIALTNSSIPNATMTLVTDDNIATLTFKTPPGGVTSDVTVCLGKPDPLPAGVQADEAYEIKAIGGFTGLFERKLTLSFKSDKIPKELPGIELATVSNGTVSYSPTIAGSVVSTPPDFSISAYPNSTGLFVVRLTK